MREQRDTAPAITRSNFSQSRRLIKYSKNKPIIHKDELMSKKLFKTSSYIQKKIVQLFSQKGIVVSIGDTKIVGLNKLCLDQLTCKQKRLQEQFLQITSLVLHISFWRSLWNVALTGEIHLQDIHGNVDFMSEAPIEVSRLLLVFKIRSRSILAQLELADVSAFIQIIKKKQESEVYVELSDLMWNDIVGVLKGHLMSDLLKNSYSKDKLSIYCYLRKKKGKREYSVFQC